MVSAAWLFRAVELARNAHRIPDLLSQPEPSAIRSSNGRPVLSVIVPACNEEAAIAATIRGILASRGIDLEVIAVDDRSTDTTGAILDGIAAEGDPRFRVLHIEELPQGWLGKPHALAQGVAVANGEYLLSVDADIRFRDDALLRALHHLRVNRIDHLILYPTQLLNTLGERFAMGALLAFGNITMPLWKIASPKTREYLGAGAFTLVTRETYETVGGWETVRMQVLEDLRFGWEVKRRHHLRQAVVYGKNLLRLRWIEGALGIVRNTTKNGFAAFGYNLPFAIASFFGLAILLFAPLAALLGPASMKWSCAPFLLALVLLYAQNRKQNDIPVVYALLFPLGAALLLFSLVRSVTLTLWNGGVVWRGTLYPLKELRREAGPIR